MKSDPSDSRSAPSPEWFIEHVLDEAFAAYESGDLDLVEQRAHAVLRLASDDYDATNLLGLAALRKREFLSALAWFSKAVALHSGESQAHVNLGLAYTELGQLEEAVGAFDQALSLEPGNGAALFGRGVALYSLRELDRAEECFRQAAMQHSDHFDTHFWHGTVLFELERFGQAAECYEEALRLQSDSVRALVGYANACMPLERYEEAVICYEKALAGGASRAEVLSNKGSALLHLDRVAEAIDCFRQAVAAHPESATLMSNLSGALHRALSHEEALAWADRAVTTDPLLANAHQNRGSVLSDLGRLDEAEESLSRAVALVPVDSEARWALGWCRLLAGDWQSGLRLFESRHERPGGLDLRSFTRPLWRGDFELAGRTILLHADGGLGDTIMFCRYVPVVEALGARVILQVPPALKGLMASLASHAEILRMGERPPPYDCHCPLMSLPLAFQSTPDSIPTPYRYLAARSERVAAVEQRLGRKGKLRVGIAWSGNALHTDDRMRSMPLLSLVMYALPPNADYYCLQKGIGDADRTVLRATPAVNCLDDILQTFDDTAALIEHMDVVVSIDTSIAHLAGALGRPTWILLARRSDWRWLLERSDTPWYASVRLFRQRDWRDWSKPLQDVELALNATLHGWVA